MENKKEIFGYFVFGVLTTLVNIICYGLLAKVANMDYKYATTIAWLVSVLFAFITNKLYVFNSKSMETKTVSKEFFSFLFFRLLSYFIDLGMMILMVEMLKIDDLYAKVIANVVVIILNFFASKFLIFSNWKNT
jgi:putative flippase GtrA